MMASVPMELIIGIYANKDGNPGFTTRLNRLIEAIPPLSKVDCTAYVRGVCRYDVHGDIFGHTANNQQTGSSMHNRNVVPARLKTLAVGRIPCCGLIQPHLASIVACIRG